MTAVSVIVTAIIVGVYVYYIYFVVTKSKTEFVNNRRNTTLVAAT